MQATARRQQQLGIAGTCTALLAVLSVMSVASGSTQILETYSSSLTDYLYASATPVQDVRPLVDQRGVNLDGSAKAPWPLGAAINGDPFGGSYNANARMGDMMLHTGTYSPTDVDLFMPDGLPIGRTYNARQDESGHHDSDGYQGVDWFQIAQPEIVLYDADSDPETLGASDVLYIVYGADRFLEFKRSAADAKQFKGKNGTAGEVQMAFGSGGEPDTYTYFDQHGNQVVFFGFDANASPAEGQFWKMIDPDGGTIFAGDESTATSAISSGFDTSGRIKTVYDKSSNGGRQYTFSYQTVDSTTRIDQVVVKTCSSGDWSSPGTLTQVASVEYDFYTSSDSDGSSGDLKLVTITLPLSTGDYVRKKYYRYYTSGSGEPVHALKYVVGFEGYRRADWEETGMGEPALDDGPLTMSDGDLEAYASAAFIDYDGDNHVLEAWFNGECGCSGGSGSGTYYFTYQDNGYKSSSSGYDTDWEDRTVIERPDGTFKTCYFDETGQSLSTIVTDSDPSGSPSSTWATEVIRDSNGCVTEIHSPASISGYSHDDGSSKPLGTFTNATGGLVTVYDRVSSGDMTGFLQATRHKDGNGASNVYYDTWMDYSGRSFKLTTTDKVVRPVMTTLRAYHAETTTAGTGTAYDETTHSYTWHDATETHVKYVAVKSVTTVLPKVSTSNNGRGSGGGDEETHIVQYLRPDGTTAFVQRAAYTDASASDLQFTYTKYNDDRLVSERVNDVDTSGTFPSGDDPNTDFGITESSAGLDVGTSYTYDAQGRLDETTLPTGRVMKRYYSSLADGRMVTLSIPRFASSTYYGPVSYAVTNHAGRVEGHGSIAFSGGSTTNGPSTWIDTSYSDPIEAAGVTTHHGTLARWAVNLYNSPGSRIEETRAYFDIPSSGAGSAGTNYDATTIGYDDMGRSWRTEDATGTVQRSVFDELGRPIERWLGTNDSSFDGGDSSGTDDMVKISEVEFDSGGDGGNSYVTAQTSFVQGSTTGERVTSYSNDYRGRRLLVSRPDSPLFTLNKYDNLGRLIATANYTGDGSGDVTASDDPTSRETDRLTLHETEYDEQGRAWKTVRHKITQATGVDADSLDSENWYDAQGRVIKTDGRQLTKTVYDRLGRVTNVITLASDDDSDYSDAAQVSGDDYVLQEQQSYFDDDSGDLLMSVVISRHFDDYGTGETTGALDTDSDLSLVDYGNSKIKGRAQITAMWYDELDRPVKSVKYGTYGGSDFDRDTVSEPSSSSDTVLLTQTAYNDDGSVLSVTDPRDKQTRYEYDDLGRKVAVIGDYVDGTPSGTTGDDDVYTRYAYTDGLQTKMWVDIDGDGTEDTEDEVTTYTYGVAKGTGWGHSTVASGRLLNKVTYPDSTSGTDVVRYEYNAQGQQIYRKDQAGNEIATDYDDVGRATTVKLSTVASGFDSIVRRIETTYTDRGMVDTVKQYDSTAGGTLLDTVDNAYDDWGMLSRQDQDHDSPASSNSIYVEYNYAKATGGRNTIRRTETTLEAPDYSGDIAYSYSSTGGLHDDDASRVTEVTMSSVSIAQYAYNGVSELIRTDLPHPEVYTSYDGATAESYDRLDRFNRPTSSIWTKDLTTDVDFYDVDVTWDRDSNVTRNVDNIHRRATSSLGDGRFDESYTIDGLNRLSSYERGNWNGSSIDNGTQGEDWTLDQVGNWDMYKLDLNGDGDYIDTGEYQDDRTHDAANQLTDRALDTDNDGNPDITYSSMQYDAAGDMTDDKQDYTYAYDPLGRLTEVLTTGMSPTTVCQYRYDGLGRRIAYNDGSHWYHFIYDDHWRIIATFREDDGAPKEFFAWHNAGLDGMGGSSYIDSVILRDKDADTAWDTASDEDLEERVYYCQNWRADVSVVLTDAGVPIEWDKYDPYGTPFNVPQGDVDSDGDTDGLDLNYEVAVYQGTDPYDVRCDMNLDGTVDSTNDYLPFLTLYFAGASGGRGVLSQGATANRFGYAGYACDDAMIRFAHVRHRVYDTMLGRWTRRDPAGYQLGSSLYLFGDARPLYSRDSSGLCNTCSISSTQSDVDHTQNNSIIPIVTSITSDAPLAAFRPADFPAYIPPLRVPINNPLDPNTWPDPFTLPGIANRCGRITIWFIATCNITTTFAATVPLGCVGSLALFPSNSKMCANLGLYAGWTIDKPCELGCYCINQRTLSPQTPYRLRGSVVIATPGCTITVSFNITAYLSGYIGDCYCSDPGTAIS